MSVDINWETLTTGPDGIALAENIRQFIHDKFQRVDLPRFIQSVQVHDFQFGTIGPQVAIKDIGDPLPGFYDDDSDSALGSQPAVEPFNQDGDAAQPPTLSERRYRRQSSNLTAAGADRAEILRNLPPHRIDTRQVGPKSLGVNGDYQSSPVLGVNTPGIPGGTSNLGYFHLPLSAGLSGTQTPLAAVAGARFPTPRPEDERPPKSESWSHNPTDGSEELPSAHSESKSFAAHHLVQPGLNAVPPTRPLPPCSDDGTSEDERRKNKPTDENRPDGEDEGLHPWRDRRPEDFQVVSHVRYAGDIKISLTVEILLDYPMPSFVGIPVRLNITGISFDGMAVLAYIRKRAHCCFLSPEDAPALVPCWDDEAEHQTPSSPDHSNRHKTELNGLVRDIKVESEIGMKENGRQSLKNVGKVEKFVLEQVRTIFEDEFVYPSFWTFLV
ncbi:MAG: Mitochondrial distribution and morphology protein 12 [Caeruleum heppii]|nr:MAG: Mitochondrial distribution and morphology protein 12 [Caeruleum heppii]